MLVMPFLRKFPDTILLMIGLTSNVLGLILLGFAYNSAMMYGGNF